MQFTAGLYYPGSSESHDLFSRAVRVEPRVSLGNRNTQVICGQEVCVRCREICVMSQHLTKVHVEVIQTALAENISPLVT